MNLLQRLLQRLHRRPQPGTRLIDRDRPLYEQRLQPHVATYICTACGGRAFPSSGALVEHLCGGLHVLRVKAPIVTCAERGLDVMRPSLAAADVRTEANSLRSDLQSVRTTAKPPLRMSIRTDRETVARLVREVMAESGVSQKAMAANAEISESVLSDALAPTGTRNLAAEWLLDQEDGFLIALLDKIQTARGLTPESRRAARAARIGELVKLLVEEVA